MTITAAQFKAMRPTKTNLVLKKRGAGGGSIPFPLAWKATLQSFRCVSDKLQPTPEHAGIAGRKFRFDFAWADQKVALEIDGGIWMKRGGHTTGTGKRRDCEKDFEAALQGWTVIRWTPDMITTENCEKLFGIITK